MTKLRYRVYYEFDGPSKAAPFRQQKIDEEIEFVLSRVQPELEIFLNDEDAKITVSECTTAPHSIFVEIETSIREDRTIEELARCVGGLDLYGEKVSS